VQSTRAYNIPEKNPRHRALHPEIIAVTAALLYISYRATHHTVTPEDTMAKILYMTAPDEQEARRIGRILVERRLAACVNILGRIESIFRWDGQVQNESEVAFIAKTSDDRVEDALAAVAELHGYDVPCAVALAVSEGLPPFLNWIDNEVRKER